MILVDSGPLVAAGAVNDPHHRVCTELLGSATEELLVPARMAELVEQYADFPLGGTDASVIAIAERLGVTKVATLDRRHFGPIQPRHTDAFTLLPETL